MKIHFSFFSFSFILFSFFFPKFIFLFLVEVFVTVWLVVDRSSSVEFGEVELGWVVV